MTRPCRIARRRSLAAGVSGRAVLANSAAMALTRARVSSSMPGRCAR